MADDGSGDDIWANTKPESEGGSTPTGDPAGPPPMPPPDPGATTVQPTTGGVDPTMVQPTTAAAAAAAAGAAGTPPGSPPPGGSESESSGWRPAWLIPALIALFVALVIGLIAVLSSGDDGSDTDTSTTTSSSEVTTTTDPLFVPVDSDGNPTTTEPGIATTIGDETTVPATDPPTTDPPATDPPTTDPPSSDPPVELPDPGFASVDGETVEIRTTCRVRPTDDGDTEIVSYLVENSSGRIVIERWFGGGTDGVDVDIVQNSDHASSGPTDGETVTDAFTATVTGDVDLDVAVNPPADGPDECLDYVETSVDDGSQTHVYVVLDVCASGFDNAGIASEGVHFSAIDNADGTAVLTFSDRTSGDLTDPKAFVDIDETIFTYIGEVSGGSDTRAILIELDLAGARECADSEKP
ncbi:MAG: hypothetical protein QNM02_06470 [Acidimicrobiia bacterium]|nr:hypothetical protein [Acidimicrobiia bacterium]